MEAFQQQSNNPHLLLLQSWNNQCKGLVAGFTTRLNGVSEAPFDSFNIGLHVQDNVAAVIENRKKLAESIGFEFSSWTCAEQVHGNRVAIVSEEMKGKGRISMEDTIKGVDALITNRKNILLTSFYADCVPLLFVDPHQQVIAVAHAGWKGTVGQIAKNVIEEMQHHFSSKPEHIFAAIGPAIDQCCYEVDEPVLNKIRSLWEDERLPSEQLKHIVRPAKEGFAYINLKEINRQIMIKAGIMSAHIEISKWCTGCSPHLFYSHRLENGKTGRMASFIGWQERKAEHDSKG